MKHSQVVRYRTLLLAATMALAGAGTVHAEPAQPAADPAAAQLSPTQRAHLQAFQEKRNELLQLGRELGKIRAEAVSERPELQKQEEQFGNMVAEEMKKHGATPSEDLAELRALEAKLRDENTPQADRQALMERLQRKAQAFDQARREALQNPELKKAQGELLQNMVAAMKDHDPRAEQLMQQMQQKQKEMLEIRNAAQEEAAKGK